MSIVKVKDKTFKTTIAETEIKQRVKELGARISHDMADKNPLFLSVLNGAFMFTADLLRAITIPCEVSFVKLASYDGVVSTGKVKKLIGLNADISGRTVVIVEDIIDTGCTMQQMLDALSQHHPASIHICTLFVKPEKLKVNLDIEYSAFSIPNDFIVGYGLDYDQQGRNLPEVYTLVES
jgi:hypoxanthine phosphoribosyltransferase